MSRQRGKRRRADYQPPQRAVPASPAAEDAAAPPSVPAASRRASRQSWLPLVGSAVLVLSLITVVVYAAASRDGTSQPVPLIGTPSSTASPALPGATS